MSGLRANAAIMKTKVRFSPCSSTIEAFFSVSPEPLKQNKTHVEKAFQADRALALSAFFPPLALFPFSSKISTSSSESNTSSSLESNAARISLPNDGFGFVDILKACISLGTRERKGYIYTTESRPQILRPKRKSNRQIEYRSPTRNQRIPLQTSLL